MTNNEKLPDLRLCNFRGFICNPPEEIICPHFKDEKHTSESLGDFAKATEVDCICFCVPAQL